MNPIALRVGAEVATAVVARALREPREDLGPALSECRVAFHALELAQRGAEELHERSEWSATLDLGAFAREHKRSGIARTVTERAEERTLSEAGLARDEQGAPMTCDRLAESSVQPRELVVPPDEFRAQDRRGRLRGHLKSRSWLRSPGLFWNRPAPQDGVDPWRIVDTLEHQSDALLHRRRAGRAHEPAHDVADEQLVLARRARETRRDVHRRADVLPFMWDWLTGMDAESDLDGP